MSNNDVIRRGGGSPQARGADEAGMSGSSHAQGYECEDCFEIFDRVNEDGVCPECQEERDAEMYADKFGSDIRPGKVNEDNPKVDR